MQKTFSIGEALRFGWEKTKKHFWFLLVAIFVASMVPTAVSFLVGSLTGWDESGFGTLLSFIVSFVLNIMVEVGIVRISLKVLDDARGTVDDFKISWSLFWRLTAGGILYALIVLAGLVLFIVPGIIFAAKYYFSYFLIIDKGMMPVEALRESGRMTKGVKGKMVLFYFATLFVILLGGIALLIGLLWAIPTVIIASAWIYRRLSEPAPEVVATVAPSAGA